MDLFSIFQHKDMSNNTATAGRLVQAAQSQSVGTFFISLGASAVAGLVQLFLFVLLKDRIPKLYQPKSFLVSARQRIRPLPPGVWQWVAPVYKTSSDELLHKAGLDAFFLCRYLWLMIKILGPAALIFIPILVPINAVGGNNKVTNVEGTGKKLTAGMGILTIANIQAQFYVRFWAHTILSIGLVIWALYVVTGELRYFVQVRQKYLTSPQHRLRASANTVLVQSLPHKWMSAQALGELFDVYPGGIRNIWLNRDYTSLQELVSNRKKLAKKLEAAETELIQACWKAHQKNSKRSNNKKDKDSIAIPLGPGLSFNNPGQIHQTVGEAVDAIHRDEEDAESISESKLPNLLERGIETIASGVKEIGRGIARKDDKGLRSRISNTTTRPNDDVQDDSSQNRMVKDENDDSIVPKKSNASDVSLPYDPQFDEDKTLEPEWKKHIKPKDRPTMKISEKWSWLPTWLNPRATKYDTIFYCRKEIARLNQIIEMQQSPEYEKNFPKMNSAFIQFNNQAAAHMACQCITHQTPTYMTPRVVEISPNDIIWKNLAITPWQRYVRRGIIFLLCIGLVIAFTPIIGAFSALAQLDALRKSTSWLRWMINWNKGLISVIQGILPVALVSFAVWFLGFLLRWVLKFSGSPTRMAVELKLQNYYFFFAFIQYFLVVTVSNALSIVFNQIKTVAQGNFNTSIIGQILQSNVPGASSYFLSQILLQSLTNSASGLLQPGPLFLFIFTKIGNPRARTKFKRRTNLENIMWGTQYPQYTVLACIALIYSVIAPLILLLTVFGFSIWWISTRYQFLYIYQYKLDTGGLLFPSAVKQLFTGIYVLEFCLFAIFAVSAAGSADGEIRWGIVFAILLFLTFVGTVLYQYIMNNAFGQLWTYLPITLEDDAVRRDEEFQKLLESKHTADQEGEIMGRVSESVADEDENPDADKLKNENEIDLEAQRKSGTAKSETPLDPEPTPAALDNEIESKRRSDSWDSRWIPNDKTGAWARKRRTTTFSSPPSSRTSATPAVPVALSNPVPAGPVMEKLMEDPTPPVVASDANVDGIAKSKEVENEVADKDIIDKDVEMETRKETEEETEKVVQKHIQKDIDRKEDIISPSSSKFAAFDALGRPVNAAGTVLGKVAGGVIGGVAGGAQVVQGGAKALLAPGTAAKEAQEAKFAQETKRLYGDITDDLEDLTSDQRDALLSIAFTHEALRAKRPCIWLPRDPLGVGDDEVRNIGRFSQWIWVSNEKQLLTAKGTCEYEGPPPDFDQINLIQL